MNSRAFTLSLIIAGMSMFMVYSYMEGQRGIYIQKYGEETAVLIAKEDIQELDLLDDSKVTVTKVPREFLAPGYLSDPKLVFNTIAAGPILKGEQVTRTRITTPGARTGLSRQVSIGKRAVSITVDGNQSVAKLIKPGDRVDILAQIDFAGGKKDLLKVRTILQDVFVLSTGMSITNSIPLVNLSNSADDKPQIKKLNSYTDYNIVTLEVDPFQAQKLIQILEVGAKPYLTLRNNDDKNIVRLPGSRILDLMGDDSNEAKEFFTQQNEKNQAPPPNKQ